MPKVKYFFKDYLLQVLTFLILFCSLSGLAILSNSVVNSLFIYSTAYPRNHYYCSNKEKQKEILHQLDPDSVFYSQTTDRFLNNEFQYISRVSENYQRSGGVSLSENIFFDFTESSFRFDSDERPSKYCVSSSSDNNGSFNFEGIQYPIIGHVSFDANPAFRNIERLTGIKEYNLYLIIDPDYDIENNFDVAAVDTSGFSEKEISKLKGFTSAVSIVHDRTSQQNTSMSLIYVGMLLPYVVLLVAFGIILRQICLFQTKEIYIKRMFGLKKRTALMSLFGERFVLAFIAFIINFAIFIYPVFLSSDYLGLTTALIFVIEILYVLIFIFIYSVHDIKQIYYRNRLGENYD